MRMIRQCLNDVAVAYPIGSTVLDHALQFRFEGCQTNDSPIHIVQVSARDLGCCVARLARVVRQL